MTDRKIYSNYVAGSAEDRTASSFARVTLKHADADVTVDPLGLPVISNNAGAVVFYENGSSIAGVTSSPLPDGSPIGIVVGSAEGAGIHPNIVVTTAGVEVTVMFRDGTAIFDNIDFKVLTTAGTAATGVTEAVTTKLTDFKTQLEKQSVKELKKATTVTPSLV